MQACLFLPGPPNFTMSNQYLHCPQSSLVQAEQLPHHPRLRYTYISSLLHLYVLGFDYVFFCHITIKICNIQLLCASLCIYFSLSWFCLMFFHNQCGFLFLSRTTVVMIMIDTSKYCMQGMFGWVKLL